MLDNRRLNQAMDESLLAVAKQMSLTELEESDSDLEMAKQMSLAELGPASQSQSITSQVDVACRSRHVTTYTMASTKHGDSTSSGGNDNAAKEAPSQQEPAANPQQQDSSMTNPGGLSDDAKKKLFYSADGIAKLCHAIQNDTGVIAEQIRTASLNIAVDQGKTAFQKVIAASTATLANTQKLVNKLEQITGAGEGNTGEPISDGLGTAGANAMSSTDHVGGGQVMAETSKAEIDRNRVQFDQLRLRLFQVSQLRRGHLNKEGHVQEDGAAAQRPGHAVDEEGPAQPPLAAPEEDEDGDEKSADDEAALPPEEDEHEQPAEGAGHAVDEEGPAQPPPAAPEEDEDEDEKSADDEAAKPSS